MRRVLLILALVMSGFISKNSYSNPINLQTFPQSVKLGIISEEQRAYLFDINNLFNNPYLLIDAKSSFNSEPLFLALNPEKPFYLNADSLGLKHLKYSSLVYEPDTEWVLFEGQEAKKKFFVLNGRKTQSFDEIDYRRGAEGISLDGKKLFFMGCNYPSKNKIDILFSEPQCFAVLSEAQKDRVFSLKQFFEHPAFGRQDEESFEISPNGEHFFFKLNNSLIWDGKLTKPVRWVEGPYFNATGDKGLSIGEWRGKYVALLNGETVSQEYDWIRCDRRRLFNAKGDWLCMAGLGQKTLFLENGKEIESFEGLENKTPSMKVDNYNEAQLAAPFYSPIDGKKIFTFVKDKKIYSWIDGKQEVIDENKGENFFYVNQVWFEKGSGEILYLLGTRQSSDLALDLGAKNKKQNQEFFIYKNTKSPTYNHIRITRYSLYDSDGIFDQLYYEASNGEWDSSKTYFFKDRLYGPFEKLEELIFSPNQKHWALKVKEKIGRSNKKNLSPEYYLVDGKKEETFSKGVNDFQFSSNSQSYLYMAENDSDSKKDRKLYFIVKGEKNTFTKAKEGVYPQVAFLPNSENFYIWRQGRSYEKCEGAMQDGFGRLCENLFSSISLGISQEQSTEGGYILTHQKIQFSEDGKKMGYLSLTPERELWWNVQEVELKANLQK